MALVWHGQSHPFADEFVITHAHSFGTDTQHAYALQSKKLQNNVANYS